mmetsp:Transcript_88042/g.235540  ORF Transcript_88042/g.235540 Transcript_88042/m.235540 type:complete len:622 (+) Transcript_88042:20-1885(+)
MSFSDGASSPRMGEDPVDDGPEASPGSDFPGCRSDPSSRPTSAARRPETGAIVASSSSSAVRSKTELSVAGKMWAEGRSCFASGKYEEAECIFGRVSELADARKTGDPTAAWTQVLGGLAQAYVDAGNRWKAERLFLQMLIWNEGTEQYKAGHFEAAQTLFDYSWMESVDWAMNELRSLSDADVEAKCPMLVALLCVNEQLAVASSSILRAHVGRLWLRMVNAGVLEILFKALETHASLLAAQALWPLIKGILSADASVLQRALSLGLVPAALSTLTRFPDAPQVIWLILIAVAKGSKRRPRAAAQLVEGGVIQYALQITEADQRIRRPALVTQYAIRLLGVTLEDTQDDALRLQAMCAIVDVLSAEVAVAEIQAAALGALLVLSPRGQALEGFLEPFIAAVPPACAALFTYGAEHQRIASSGAAFIWRATVDHTEEDLACKAIVELNGLQSCLNCMAAWPGHSGVMRHCCGVLRNLTCGRDTAKTLLVKGGGFAALGEALKGHLRDPLVVEQACAGLQHIMDTPHRVCTFLRVGGAEASLDAIKAGSDRLATAPVWEEATRMALRVLTTALEFNPRACRGVIRQGPDHSCMRAVDALCLPKSRVRNEALSLKEALNMLWN